MSHGRRKPLPQWRSAVASNNLAPETYRSGQAPTTGAPPASATARQRLAAGTARPPDCGRGTWMRLGELSSLLIFLVRAGWGYGRWLFSASKELGCGGLCPHPLRKLSFLRTFHLLPTLRTRGAANPNAGASHYHNGAAPSLRSILAPETYRSSRAATKAAWTASVIARQRLRAGSACRVWNPAVRSSRVTVGKRVWRYFWAEAAPCCFRMTRISAPSSVRCSFASANSR